MFDSYSCQPPASILILTQIRTRSFSIRFSSFVSDPNFFVFCIRFLFALFFLNSAYFAFVFVLFLIIFNDVNNLHIRLRKTYICNNQLLKVFFFFVLFVCLFVFSSIFVSLFFPLFFY